MKYLLLLLALRSGFLGADGLSTNSLYGDQVLPQHEKSDGRIPGDNVLPNLNLGQVGLQTILEESNRIFMQAEEKNEEFIRNFAKPPEDKPKESNTTLAQRVNTPRTKQKQPLTKAPNFPQRGAVRRKKEEKGGVVFFPSNLRYRRNLGKPKTYTIPANGAAVATLDYGVHVRAGQYDTIGMTLNSAFVEPNDAVVELTGCRVSINITADTHKERIIGNAGFLSCRASDEHSFQVPIKAKLVDALDNAGGISGVTVFNGAVDAAIAALISDGISQFGKAMAAAQVTTQVNTNDSGNISAQGANVSGDANKYIAGKTIAGATGRFLNSYIDYAESRKPTVEVASGRRVFLYAERPIKIPSMYFRASSRKKIDGEKIPKKSEIKEEASVRSYRK